MNSELAEPHPIRILVMTSLRKLLSLLFVALFFCISGNLQAYQYCGNDPINKHDPVGLSEMGKWVINPSEGQFGWVSDYNAYYYGVNATLNGHADYSYWDTHPTDQPIGSLGGRSMVMVFGPDGGRGLYGLSQLFAGGALGAIPGLGPFMAARSASERWFEFSEMEPGAARTATGVQAGLETIGALLYVAGPIAASETPLFRGNNRYAPCEIITGGPRSRAGQSVALVQDADGNWVAEMPQLALQDRPSQLALTGSSQLQIQRYIDAPGGLKRVADSTHALIGPQKGINQTTVSLARVVLCDGSSMIMASGNGGYLRPKQIEHLVRMGVPRENILSGAKYYRGFTALENHAERVILRNVGNGGSAAEWGISWAGKNCPFPCKSCWPFVKPGVGNLLQLGD